MKKYTIENDSIREVEIVAEGNSLVIVKCATGEFSVKVSELYDTELQAAKRLVAVLQKKMEDERNRGSTNAPQNPFVWPQPHPKKW